MQHATTMTLSIEQTCEILGCGRTKVFELLALGTLERAPRYGRGLRIFEASVRAALVRPPAPERKRRRRRAVPERILDIPLPADS